jgi:hypothetical protein
MEKTVKKVEEYSFWEINSPLMGKQVPFGKATPDFITPRDAD